MSDYTDRGDGPTAAAPSAPIRVLFVCTGNICRSAYAEVVARHLLSGRTDVEVSSAGTYGLAAQPLNPEIAEFLPEGVAGGPFASRSVTGALVDDADLILTAETSHRAFLIAEYPRAFRRVLTLGQFAEAAGRSDLRGRRLVDQVSRQHPRALPEQDVRDPYRRGRGANAEAAARINELLAVVLPALSAGPTDAHMVHG